jgi:hypothetical protein
VAGNYAPCRMVVTLCNGGETVVYGCQPDLAEELERLGNTWHAATMSNRATKREFRAERITRVEWVKR